MSARPTMLILVAGTLVLAPLAMAQDHAVPRGGGSESSGGGGSSGGHPGVSSSGGGSSSSGSSHSGSSGSSYSGSGSSSSGSSWDSSSRPVPERRHPRPGTGTGNTRRGGPYYSYPHYDYYYGHRGYYYSGVWGWPWGWYGGGGYWGQPYGYGWGTTYHYVRRETGAIRVLVDPSEARVYVDGYYAGVVDDFDGLFQRLNLSPGRHEIAIKLEGYQSHRMKVYVAPDRTLKLHYTMQKGNGETFEDLVGGAPEQEARRDGAAEPQVWSERQRGAPDEESLATLGRLRLSVRPGDASVYVDGGFRGTAREASSVQLPSGRHRIEVVRPGYRTVEREIEITPGESTEVTIELEKSTI